MESAIINAGSGGVSINADQTIMLGIATINTGGSVDLLPFFRTKQQKVSAAFGCGAPFLVLTLGCTSHLFRKERL